VFDAVVMPHNSMGLSQTQFIPCSDILVGPILPHAIKLQPQPFFHDVAGEYSQYLMPASFALLAVELNWVEFNLQ